MPNKVVDLGFYSPYWWQIDRGVTPTPQQNDTYALDIHTRMATLDDGLNWTVGRLFPGWVPLTTTDTGSRCIIWMEQAPPRARSF